MWKTDYGKNVENNNGNMRKAKQGILMNIVNEL